MWIWIVMASLFMGAIYYYYYRQSIMMMMITTTNTRIILILPVAPVMDEFEIDDISSMEELIRFVQFQCRIRNKCPYFIHPETEKRLETIEEIWATHKIIGLFYSTSFFLSLPWRRWKLFHLLQ